MQRFALDFPQVPGAESYLIYRLGYSDINKKGRLAISVDAAELPEPDVKTVGPVYPIKSLRSDTTYQLPHQNIVPNTLKLFLNSAEFNPASVALNRGQVRLNRPLKVGDKLTAEYKYFGYTVFDDGSEQPGVKHHRRAPGMASPPGIPHTLSADLDDKNRFTLSWSAGKNTATNYYYKIFAKLPGETEVPISTEIRKSIVVEAAKYLVECSYDGRIFWTAGETNKTYFHLDSIGMPPPVQNLIGEQRFTKDGVSKAVLLWNSPPEWSEPLYIRIKAVSVNDTPSIPAYFESTVDVPSIANSILIKKKLATTVWSNDWPTLDDDSEVVLETSDKVTSFHDEDVELRSIYNYTIWTKNKEGTYSSPRHVCVKIDASKTSVPVNLNIHESVE